MTTTTLKFTLSEEQYGRLANRLRYVIQHAEETRVAAEEALSLLESEPVVEDGRGRA